MKPTVRKIAQICSIAVSIGVVILAVIQLLDLWTGAPYVYIPLMGVNLLLQAYAQWEKNRSVAIFSLVCAGIVFVCAGVVFILK